MIHLNDYFYASSLRKQLCCLVQIGNLCVAQNFHFQKSWYTHWKSKEKVKSVPASLNVFCVMSFPPSPRVTRLCVLLHLLAQLFMSAALNLGSSLCARCTVTSCSLRHLRTLTFSALFFVFFFSFHYYFHENKEPL